MYKRKVRILFLCTGNACRSQMAEGIAKQLGAEYLEVKSAGTEAHGKNPKAITAMQRIGIDISAQMSSVLDKEQLNWCDTLITLCGHAHEHCPVLPVGSKTVHWPVTDPAKATGATAEIEQAFDSVRDDIQSRIRGLIGGLKMLDKE